MTGRTFFEFEQGLGLSFCRRLIGGARVGGKSERSAMEEGRGFDGDGEGDGDSRLLPIHECIYIVKLKRKKEKSNPSSSITK